MEKNLKDLKHLKYVIFAIEVYKTHKNLDGMTAYNMLKGAGAIEYIDDCYDALHTFGNSQLVNSIDEFLKNNAKVA